MTSDRERIQSALQALRQEEAPDFVSAVEDIVWANVRRGRLRKFLRNGTVANSGDYVRRVAVHYRRECGYVAAVQGTEDPDVWQPLFTHLQKWAYKELSKKEFLDRYERFNHAGQCAADAAVVICKRRFPYDTHFGAWTYTVVVYTCANHARKARNSRSVPDQAQVSLDAWDGWSQSFADPAGERAHRRVEQRLDLLQLVSRLADSQRKFVLLHYFENKSYEEIAGLMGRSKNALYKLNFDALTNLRKKMLLSQHNYE